MTKKFLKFAASFTFALLAYFLFFNSNTVNAAPNSFTKEVRVVSRNSLPATDTNPYQVMEGDVLEFTIKTRFLETGNINNRATITDEMPKIQFTGQRGSCAYVDGSAKASSSYGSFVSSDIDSVVFSYNISSSHYEETFTYQCRIDLKSSTTNPAISSAYSLPEVMVGQLKIEQTWDGLNDNKIFYAGMPANEIIVNYDPNNLVGYASPFAGCSEYWPRFPAGTESCYNLNRRNIPAVRNMVSQTRAESTKVLEISALIYSDAIIMGDAYSTGDNNYLNTNGINFSFLGRNLSQRGSSTLDPSSPVWGQGATWKADSAINMASQSYYDPANEGYYNQRIKQLQSEAQVITNANLNTPTWYLQCPNITMPCSDEDKNKYPEGKVWVTDSAVLTGNVSVSRNITYDGIGTIIITGKLSFENSKSLTPKTNKDSLGFIVIGGAGNDIGVTFKQIPNTAISNIKFQGVIFCKKNFDQMGAGLTLIGSFVAKGYNFRYPGIRMYYDYRLDSGWPPGFRYFNMPTAKNSSS